MGVGQIAAVAPIMHHEEPPGNLLPSRVQRVACDGLLNLRLQRPVKADQEIANVRAAFEFRSQKLDRNPKQAAPPFAQHFD